MSFFEEDPEPARSRPAPRRSARTGGPGGGDPVRNRRLAFIGALVVVLFVLVLVVNSCRSDARKDALRSYAGDVTRLGAESQRDVGAPLFKLLKGAGGKSGDSGGADTPQLVSDVAGLRVTAESLLRRAEGLSVPGQAMPAQRSLLIALQFRRDAVGRIARELRAALGDQPADALRAIAGEMTALQASDVIYDQRVVPLLKAELRDADVGSTRVGPSQLVPDIGWLSPVFVAEQMDVTPPRPGGRGAAPTPGTHGTGLLSTAVGDTTLKPDAANRIPASGNPTFMVKVANQGDNDEFEIDVEVTVEADGAKAIQATKTIPTIAAGQETTVAVPLGSAPDAGTSATIQVEVKKVPGEENTDNNKQSYPAVFTR